MIPPLRPLIPNPHAGQTLCAHCHTWRDPRDVQAVERLRTGVVRYLCRRDTEPRCIRWGLLNRSVDRLIPTTRGDT